MYNVLLRGTFEVKEKKKEKIKHMPLIRFLINDVGPPEVRSHTLNRFFYDIEKLFEKYTGCSKCAIVEGSRWNDMLIAFKKRVQEIAQSICKPN